MAAAGGNSAHTNRRRRRQEGMMSPIMGVLTVVWVVLETLIRRPSTTLLKLKEQRNSYGGGGELARYNCHSHHVHNDESDPFPSDSSAAPELEFDESRLIDFGVVGFPKCGTTFLLWDIFGQSKQVFMAAGGMEFQELEPKDLGKLRDTFRPHINDTAANGAPVRRGFKQPNVLMSQSMLKNLQENFPTMKFIVTLRHPVLWFQSFYNFMLREGEQRYPMPSPRKTVGLCGEACEYKGQSGHCIQNKSPFCSGQSNYHHYLSRMGYTGMDTKEELLLLDHHEMEIFNFSQTKLFLTEIGQMDGKNMTVTRSLFRAIEHFLDLEEHALPDTQPYLQPDYTWTQEQVEGRIDICDDDNEYIRAHLLSVARKAGLWIEKYFLNSQNVVVADREDLVNRIRQWAVDPCKS